MKCVCNCGSRERELLCKNSAPTTLLVKRSSMLPCLRIRVAANAAIPVTVIDMRAASTDRIEPWLRNVDFDMLFSEYGVRFTAIGVVDTSSDSVANIGFWASDVLAGNKKIRYVIGRNLVRGVELGYDTSEDRKKYQKTLDLAEVEIPKLEDWVHAQLESGDLRVATALEIKDASHPLTEFMNRSRLKKYQQRVFAEFERIKERLLP